jgi:hypothetical protein
MTWLLIHGKLFTQLCNCKKLLLTVILARIVSGFGGALFVYIHRRVVELRRKYRKKTLFLERK